MWAWLLCLKSLLYKSYWWHCLQAPAPAPPNKCAYHTAQPRCLKMLCSSRGRKFSCILLPLPKTTFPPGKFLLILEDLDTHYLLSKIFSEFPPNKHFLPCSSSTVFCKYTKCIWIPLELWLNTYSLCTIQSMKGNHSLFHIWKIFIWKSKE